MFSAKPAPNIVRQLSKYFWWMKPDEALADRRRLTLRTMDIGTWNDVLFMLEHFSVDELREHLLSAQPGEIRPRAIPFWLHKLEVPEEHHFKLADYRFIPNNVNETDI